MKNINKNDLEEYQNFASRCWHSCSDSLLEYNQKTLEDLLNSSKSISISNFSISTEAIYGIDLDITFEANDHKSQLWIAESVNYVPNIFHFLEAIISTNYNEYFYSCEEEGPETFLYVKRVKKDDIQFCHISERIQFAEYIQTEDFKIRLDIIVNQKEFIKTFYNSIMSAVQKITAKTLRQEGFIYQIDELKVLKKGSKIIEDYLNS